MHSKNLQNSTAFLNISGTCFWVAGAARSGVAAALLLKKNGAHVFVSDAGIISSESKVELENAQILFEEGTHSLSDFIQNADFLVLSPTIPLCKGLALAALQNSIPVLSEIEVASWALQSTQKVIGITGTNGKSTVTHYLAQLFKRAGKKAVACGNIGLPFASAVSQAIPFEVFALELSSYQLETTVSLRPAATLFLNLQSDHLARYQSMEQYLRAKWRLVLLTADSGVCALDFSVLKMALKCGLTLPACQIIVLHFPWPSPKKSRQQVLNRIATTAQKLPIAIYHELEELSAPQMFATSRFGFAGIEEQHNGQMRFVYQCGEKHFEHSIAEPCIPGEHNLQNLSAASAVALYLELSPIEVFSQWEQSTTTYTHLPHRLEFIGSRTVCVVDSKGRKKTISIVNDSKATNVESTVVALKSFSKNVRLLLGGEPKGESFIPLTRFFSHPIVRCYPFGAAASVICEDLQSSPAVQALPALLANNSKHLLEAAKCAVDEANDGDTLLLSPACASFDEFKNFEHRGDIFREWGLKLVIANPQPQQEK